MYPTAEVEQNFIQRLLYCIKKHRFKPSTSNLPLQGAATWWI